LSLSCLVFQIKPQNEQRTDRRTKNGRKLSSVTYLASAYSRPTRTLGTGWLFQSPVHSTASLSQPTLTALQLCPEFMVVGHSSAVSIFHQTSKSDLARRGFRYSALAVCNSLPRTVLESPSIRVFKSRLKIHLLIWPTSNSNDMTCATTGSELQPMAG